MAPKFSKDTPLDDDILHSFRVCPQADIARARALQPKIMECVELIADTLCVDWQSCS
jgi:hypothetical protein